MGATRHSLAPFVTIMTKATKSIQQWTHYFILFYITIKEVKVLCIRIHIRKVLKHRRSREIQLGYCQKIHVASPRGITLDCSFIFRVFEGSYTSPAPMRSYYFKTVDRTQMITSNMSTCHISIARLLQYYRAKQQFQLQFQYQVYRLEEQYHY